MPHKSGPRCSENLSSAELRVVLLNSWGYQRAFYDMPNVLTFTLFRDPVRRLLSAYRFRHPEFPFPMCARGMNIEVSDFER